MNEKELKPRACSRGDMCLFCDKRKIDQAKKEQIRSGISDGACIITDCPINTAYERRNP